MAVPASLFGFLVLAWSHQNVLSEVCTKKICEYEFVVRESRSMMYRPDPAQAAYQVIVTEDGQLKLKPGGYHTTVPDIEVPLEKVHTVDGTNRTIITINDQFPGPTIEVLEGAEIVVTVVNDLLKESLAIHWHGLHMRNNPWMDGVPFVGQCPIGVKERFQYRFIADPPGTHWYHSHLEMQKADGLFGALIIHRSQPRLPYHVVTLHDWFPWHSTDIELSNPFRIERKGYGDIFYDYDKRGYAFDGTLESPIYYWSGLVNGKGRHLNNSSPVSVFKVKPGTKYHLHVINAGLVYAYRFAIDQHKLIAIESDGHRVKPVEVDSAIIHNGESFVFEVTTKQQPIEKRYWVRGVSTRANAGSAGPPDGVVWDAKAILEYEGAVSTEEPTTEERNCIAQEPCVVLNCAWRTYGTLYYPHRTCINAADLRIDNTFYDPEKLPDTRNDDVHEIFLYFGFPIGGSVNGKRYLAPQAPLFQDPNTWGLTECSEECTEKGCRCTHVVEFPAKRTIQLVMTTTWSSLYSHPVHIHGHSFQVLKMGYGIQNQTTGEIIGINPDITCENNVCSKMHWTNGPPKDLNFDNPPLKDTVSVPGYGYTVVRLVSDNPGYWLVHCHVGNHQSEGMAFLINESFAHHPPPPRRFPTCENFNIEHSEFRDMLERNKQCGNDQSAEGCSTGKERSERLISEHKQGSCEMFMVYFTALLCLMVGILVILLASLIFYCYVAAKRHQPQEEGFSLRFRESNKPFLKNKSDGNNNSDV